MKFETMRIHFLRDVFVFLPSRTVCHHALTNSPIYCDRWKIDALGSGGGGVGGRGVAHQQLGMVERKRNRGNGVTDIHQVGGMRLGTKRGPTFFKFQPICRPRHRLRQKEEKSFKQYLNTVRTGTRIQLVSIKRFNK